MSDIRLTASDIHGSAVSCGRNKIYKKAFQKEGLFASHSYIAVFIMQIIPLTRFLNEELWKNVIFIFFRN